MPSWDKSLRLDNISNLSTYWKPTGTNSSVTIQSIYYSPASPGNSAISVQSGQQTQTNRRSCGTRAEARHVSLTVSKMLLLSSQSHTVFFRLHISKLQTILYRSVAFTTDVAISSHYYFLSFRCRANKDEPPTTRPQKNLER